MDNKEWLEEALRIARVAGLALLEFQPKAKEIERSGKDFLTTADLMSNDIIERELLRLAPWIPIYSEEKVIDLKTQQGLVFIVDPLDGTRNFFYQDVFWGVSIALADMAKQEVSVGAIFCPALGWLVGATREGKVVIQSKMSLAVSRVDNLAKASIWMDWGKNSMEVCSLLPKLAAVSMYPQIRLCSTASLLAVATGRADAYVHPKVAFEDTGAGALIVQRAGGRVTDRNGNPFAPFSDSLVASNGLVHEQILRAIN